MFLNHILSCLIEHFKYEEENMQMEGREEWILTVMDKRKFKAESQGFISYISN